MHSFETLMADLASRARVTYKLESQAHDLTLKQVPALTPLQARAHELLGLLPVNGK